MGQIPDKCNCFSGSYGNRDFFFENSDKIVEGPDSNYHSNPQQLDINRSKAKREGGKSIQKVIVFYSDKYPKSSVNSVVLFQALVRGVCYRIKYKAIKAQLEKETLNLLREYTNKFTTKILVKAESNAKHAYTPEGWKKHFKKGDKNFEINYGKTYKTNILVFNSGNSIYSGSTNINGKKQGFGVCLHSNGSKFEGFWIKDEFEGWGKHIDKDGNVFIGKFSLNKLLGVFRNGKLNGYGERYGVVNSFYYGEFKNGLKHGKGKDDNIDYIYEGEYNEDKKHGNGKLVYKKVPDIYEGEFRDGSITGVGCYTWANKDSYRGPMINGKMHGKGYYKWPDGSEYTGEYINNIKEGFGRFKWANGRVFEGPFVSGKPHGIGKLQVGSSTFAVEFKNGKLTKNVNKSHNNSKEEVKL